MSGTGIYDAASLRWAADVDWGPLQEFLGVDEGPSEKELVLDALFALGGVDGKFLRLHEERQVYDIDESFNVAPWNRYAWGIPGPASWTALSLRAPLVSFQ